MKKLILCLALVQLVSCGGSSGGGSDKKNSGDDSGRRVDLRKLPADVKLSESKDEGSLVEIQKLFVHQAQVSNFIITTTDTLESSYEIIRTVGINYTEDYPGGSSTISGVVSKPGEAHYSGATGNCGMSSNNGRVETLEGYCVLQIEVKIPKSMKIEVYHGDILKTKRFYAMSFATFIENLQFKSDQDIYSISKDFINSYKSTKTELTLTVEQLIEALEMCRMSEAKLKELKLMHKYVLEREGLSDMIEDIFVYFDREKARKIVGLN